MTKFIYNCHFFIFFQTDQDIFFSVPLSSIPPPVVVLAGLGSMSGTLVAGLLLGVAESIVLMMFGASWAPAVAFGLLLVMLGLRPQGLFGR